MDYRHRKYYLINFNVWSDFDLECQEMLIKKLNCKIYPPYSHYQEGEYDGHCIDRYASGMISVPISKDEEFHNLVDSKMYNIRIVCELTKGNCGH